jgi:hypothetical protein
MCIARGVGLLCSFWVEQEVGTYSEGKIQENSRLGQVYTNGLSKILKEFLAGEEEYPENLSLASPPGARKGTGTFIQCSPFPVVDSSKDLGKL